MLWMSGSKKEPQYLADVLTWAAVIGPGLILNKDGSFQKTLRFQPPDAESATTAEMLATRLRINNVLTQLGRNWAIFVEANRFHQGRYFQNSEFPDPVSEQIDIERRQGFLGATEYYETHYYLTFVYMPPPEIVSFGARWLIEESDGKKSPKDSNYYRYIDYFEETITGLQRELSAFLVTIDALDDDETLTYLHQCVSDRRHPVHCPDVAFDIDMLLTDSEFVGGLSPKLGRNHLFTIGIKTFVTQTYPQLLQNLGALPYPYRWMSRWLCLDKEQGRKFLEQRRQQWFRKRKGLKQILGEALTREHSVMEDPEALSRAEEANDALNELGSMSFGYFTPSITVWDSDIDVARDRATEVSSLLNGLGFVTVVESFNAVEAWLGSLPGHLYANVRQPVVSSLNLCDMLPLASLWSGPVRNEHLNADPLMMTKAHSSVFRFDLHQGDVGHTMIIGPTGSGKSTLLSLLAAQFLRYREAQVYIFDKGASARAMTLAVGGDFFQLGESQGLVFQPLAGVDDESERQWAKQWLSDLLHHKGVSLTPEYDSELWQTLTNFSASTVTDRTLSVFSALLQPRVMSEALKPFTVDGPHGYLLDAQEERLHGGHWQTFELESLMNSEALMPVLTYIFHRLEQRMDGRPTLLILDEAWLFLDHTLFASQIKDWLKTLRKKNASVVFAAQSLADVSTSSIAATLIDSCPTRIFLPNTRALEPTLRAYYEDFGLNDRQIEIIATARPKRDYYYQSDAGCRLFELALGPLAKTFTTSSRASDHLLMDDLLASYGNGQQFADALFKAKTSLSAA